MQSQEGIFVLKGASSCYSIAITSDIEIHNARRRRCLGWHTSIVVLRIMIRFVATHDLATYIVQPNKPIFVITCRLIAAVNYWLVIRTSGFYELHVNIANVLESGARFLPSSAR